MLSQLTVARFSGSGSESIQAMTSDKGGYIYIAGTTSSPDLTVKNAAQPIFGEAALIRSLDRGATWQKIPNAPASIRAVTSHPTDPQTLFAGALDGIYKTTDGGQTWRRTYTFATPLQEPCRQPRSPSPSIPPTRGESMPAFTVRVRPDSWPAATAAKDGRQVESTNRLVSFSMLRRSGSIPTEAASWASVSASHAIMANHGLR